jgi:Holliday junction resolvasome RuvABC DNA-binding subunit
MNLDRDAVAKIVMNTSMTMAEGYRASTTSFSTDAQKDKSQACAVAAHNAGIFVLQELGFSKDEIKALVKASMLPPVE